MIDQDAVDNVCQSADAILARPGMDAPEVRASLAGLFGKLAEMCEQANSPEAAGILEAKAGAIAKPER